ncbi:alpha/beta hydrolase-fold protein [Aneurinibacillus sp. Ricciae_BoGa-3]|uniref:alpha/beta hydrolase n=1 Tax=Aneurinibacillus sp. Ricciae_BoGa-3 TaxID=3022697 RepID=UPI0023416B73|nr:alpha/beta hydrolase-fold protein [Aneurinibacillus sp. Ricciae_BoGa-3]WCK52333.1 alpha/beta hydrolase-fold protein [Aneurinibacillus sp. Ricciae_BoGa-3]
MKSPLPYKILLPAKIEEEKKYPVIFVMHGIGSNEENVLSLVQELRDDFILIGIRGPLNQGNGFAYFTIQGYGNPHRDIFDESIAKLEKFIDYAAQTYPIDENHQYLLGFSQGAILSMTLALTMGNKIKGIVALNGYVPQFVKEEYRIKRIDDVSIYISHGEFDPIFPLQIGKENKDFFTERSQNVRFTTYPVGHEVSHENQKDFVKWVYQDLNSSK